MKLTETNAVAEYVAEVTKLAKTSKTTEHSFRGALATLIDALAPGLKAVYINPTQYFDNVPLAAYEQAIGGYHPAEKWLKDRKGRALTQDDLRHYQRIILALAKTYEIMKALH